jgi:hypothetical protein
MDWIKKNPDRFTLALLSVALLAVAILLFLQSGSFGERFSEAASVPARNNQIPAVDTAVLAQAKQQLEKPGTWEPRKDAKGNPIHSGRLFTSESYYLTDVGQLKKPDQDSLYNDTDTGKPIPNTWFLGHSFPLLDKEVPFMDPDNDGFLNQDEWRWNTDPTNKNSMPPYHGKLYVKQWKRYPFRLKFQSYNGDPAKDPVEKLDFQIDTIDLNRPSAFLKVGEMAERTPYKVIKFQFKEIENPATGDKTDVSELTLINTETNQEVNLVLGKVVDSPSDASLFEYRFGVAHGGQGQVFEVPRLKEFVLKPKVDQRYKLLDVNQNGAVIETPSKEKYTVPNLSAPAK